MDKFRVVLERKSVRTGEQMAAVLGAILQRFELTEQDAEDVRQGLDYAGVSVEVEPVDGGGQ